MSLQSVVSEIQRNDSFCITSHMSPEGDAVGSSLALAMGLRSIGKNARVILRDPLPERLSFLSDPKLVSIQKRLTVPVEILMVLDCGDLQLTGFFG